MSHFTEIKVVAEVKNERDLIAALEEHFGEGAVEVSDKPLKLSGYDSSAGKTAHIRIKKEFVAKANGGWAYNDLGYERGEDGKYVLHADPVDFKPANRSKVAQSYTENVFRRAAKLNGWAGFKKEVQKDGKVKLVAMKYLK